MVSFMLGAVKFLLIYRYLQYIYWFKRGIRLCPSHLRGLRIAQPSRRTTQKAHAWYILVPYVGNPYALFYGLSAYTATHGRVSYTYREHSSLSCLLKVFGSCEVSKVKDKRQINALFVKSSTCSHCSHRRSASVVHCTN